MDGNFKPRLGSWVSLLFVLIFFSLSAWAEKTDVVYLKNGDRITGELKSLERGKLELSTDFMGTLYIDWINVREIVSKTGQSIEMTDGQRHYGSLSTPEMDGALTVSTSEGMANVDINDVVSMYPVESNFWDRLDLEADLGLSWDKGSNVGKYNFGLETEYRRKQSMTRASLISEITTQSTENDTHRTVLTGVHNIFKPNKKFHSYFANLESNDQLGVDLRALAGAGYGWVPIRSQRNWFSFGVGLDVNREIPTTGESETNLEGVGFLSYEYYKFSTPERSFKTDFRVFPSITDWGRWRSDLTMDFKFEIVTDFFWKMSFYASYDTASLSSGDASSDYGLISSFGYKF